MSDASGAISGDDEEDEAAMEQELRRRMQESICSASAQRNTIKKQARVMNTTSCSAQLGELCYLHLKNEETGNELCAMPIKR